MYRKDYSHYSSKDSSIIKCKYLHIHTVRASDYWYFNTILYFIIIILMLYMVNVYNWKPIIVCAWVITAATRERERAVFN